MRLDTMYMYGANCIDEGRRDPCIPYPSGYTTSPRDGCCTFVGAGNTSANHIQSFNNGPSPQSQFSNPAQMSPQDYKPTQLTDIASHHSYVIPTVSGTGGMKPWTTSGPAYTTHHHLHQDTLQRSAWDHPHTMHHYAPPDHGLSSSNFNRSSCIFVPDQSTGSPVSAAAMSTVYIGTNIPICADGAQTCVSAGWGEAPLPSATYRYNPLTGKTRTKDKYRVVYTDRQRAELENEFRCNQYITIRRKTEIAGAIGLSERQVKIWFQNRRAKERKVARRRATHPDTGPNTQTPEIRV